VGLLAEEFGPFAGRMLGNFPQAYGRVGLINGALNLTRETRPAEVRRLPARGPSNPPSPRHTRHAVYHTASIRKPS